MLVKRTLRRFLREVVLGIPISAILAGVLYFFTSVLFKGNTAFTDLWRIAYLFLLGVDVALAVASLIYSYALWSFLAKKWNVPIAIVEKAALEYSLHKQPGFHRWSAEEFKSYMDRTMLIFCLADAVLDAVRNPHRH